MLFSTEKAHDPIHTLIENERQISIITLVAALIERAGSLQASDIHIDPTHDHLRVRFRIDGLLHDKYQLPKYIHGEIISRIKVLSGLRTDEHHATQDGRFRHMNEKENAFDIRVSIAPTYHGENAVLRLLYNRDTKRTLGELGFSSNNDQKIKRVLNRSSGMLLVTGPTGSGKTTTLYTLLELLNRPESALVTIEDPIEYSIESIKQIQVEPRTNLTFAKGLRSILRQDPDIIMVGEIRDSETAHIAVNAALTGHLLLSTLHTNDAATCLPRLLDMGVDTYLVASTISAVMSQRLVRTICESCKSEKEVTKALVSGLKDIPMTKPLLVGEHYFEGTGCQDCNGTGFSGRIAISEVLIADEKIRDAILNKSSHTVIKKIAIENGMIPLTEDGFDKVRSGTTTIGEVLRAMYE